MAPKIERGHVILLHAPTVQGRHVCAIAPTPEASARTAARWIRDGLDAGLRVVWSERSGGRVRESLERQGVAWEAALEAGALVVAPPDQVLRIEGPGDVPRRIAAARGLIARAVADGYAGLSFGIELRDALSVMPNVSDQLVFEAAWESFTREHPLWLLCLYGPGADAGHVDSAIPLHPRELETPAVSARLADGVVTVAGEVDTFVSTTLRTYLRAAAREQAPSEAVVIDLGSLAFIDLDGVRTLLALAREHAARLRVLDPPSSFRRVVEIAGWADEFEIAQGPR